MSFLRNYKKVAFYTSLVLLLSFVSLLSHAKDQYCTVQHEQSEEQAYPQLTESVLFSCDHPAASAEDCKACQDCCGHHCHFAHCMYIKPTLFQFSYSQLLTRLSSPYFSALHAQILNILPRPPSFA